MREAAIAMTMVNVSATACILETAVNDARDLAVARQYDIPSFKLICRKLKRSAGHSIYAARRPRSCGPRTRAVIVEAPKLRTPIIMVVITVLTIAEKACAVDLTNH
jgi:hypothetical protein